MSRLTRRAFSRSLLALTLAAAGPLARAQQGAPGVLRIGYQKSSTLITLLKARGTLEQALAPLSTRVEWHEFASGLPLTEALNVCAVDFSADVADTVPVFAQAAQARFVYLAQEAPSPSAQAILVKRDSGIDTLAALKGKDIATTKAAGSHYLLLAALAKAGLAPADGRAAFERGSVGAWITWDPYVASVDRRPEVKVLADGRHGAGFLPALLPRGQRLRGRASGRAAGGVRRAGAGRRLVARASGPGRGRAGADLGARRGHHHARQRAAQLCGARRDGRPFRRAAEDRRHLRESGPAAGARRHATGAALGFRGAARGGGVSV